MNGTPSAIIHPGGTVRVNYGGESKDFIWHIVEIINDGGYEMVVYRQWAKRKQIWMYHVDSLDHFVDMVQTGKMKKA